MVARYCRWASILGAGWASNWSFAQAEKCIGEDPVKSPLSLPAFPEAISPQMPMPSLPFSS